MIRNALINLFWILFKLRYAFVFNILFYIPTYYAICIAFYFYVSVVVIYISYFLLYKK